MSVKEDLNKLITDVKLSKFQQNAGKDIVKNIEKELVEAMKPVLRDLAFTVGQSVRQAIGSVKIETPTINVSAPQVNVPDVYVPTPQVNYTPPAINVPKMEMPDEMNIKGWVGLMGVNMENPLPVQLRDATGKPVNLLENLTTIIGGNGGGRGVVRVSGYDGSAFGSILNADGRLRVETSDGASSDTTIVNQVSGANWSVKVTSFDTSIAASLIDSSGVEYSGDNPVPTKIVDPAGNVMDLFKTGDNFVAANDFGVLVYGVVDTTTANYMRPLHMRDVLEDGYNDSQVSLITESFGVIYDSNAGTWDRVRANSGETGPGVMRTVQATDAIASTQTKLIARTTNPTATSNATTVFASADDLGRTLTRPIQVRDLIITAYATLTDSSEDTLLTGAASTFHDLIYIMGANQSDAAVNINIRSTTAGPVVCTLSIPANATAGVSLPVPIPQMTVADTWTAQNSGSDISNTTVILSGLFSKEI